MPDTYDFIVIGGGSAGYNAAQKAVDLGKKVAVIDAAETLGGLCILRGCMPSKTLIYAAEVLHHARHAGRFGLNVPRAEADMKRVAERKRTIIADFASDRERGLTSGRFDLYRSFARFKDGRSIELADGTVLQGRKFLVATGSVVNQPPVPGLDNTPLWTSDDVLDLDFVPESVLVFGGGIVGCELAQYLRRIGSKVTLIQRGPQILKDFSEDAARIVETAFRDEGIELFTDTEIREIRPSGDRVEVVFEHRGREVRCEAAHGLNALGRSADTAGLNLDAAGVKRKKNGQIETDAFQQSSNPDIYAAGDCAGPYEIVHIAVRQGETAAQHAFGKPVPPMNYRQLLIVVFTDPQIARAGATEEDLKAAGADCLAASYPFNDHGRSILMEALYGQVKVLAAPEDGRILGAEIVGKDAGELIHSLSTALALRATVTELLDAPWYHPTLSEIITYPLEEIAERLG